MVFHDDDVEFAVVEGGVREETERTAVAAAVADEGDGAGEGFSSGGADGEYGGGLLEGAEAAEDVAEGAELFFAFPCGTGDDAGVEAGAGELDEVGVVCAPEVDGAGDAAFDDGPAFVHAFGGEAEVHGEDVHGAGGEEAESGGAGLACGGDAVDDLVDGAVAACGDDDGFACGGEGSGDVAGVSGFAGGVEDDAVAEGFEFVDAAFSLSAAGAGVEDDGDRRGR